MFDTAKKRGREGEARIGLFLEKKGYCILKRNYSILGAEIDIIALDKEELVFIEVKTWSALDEASLELSINAKKVERIHRAAMHFLSNGLNSLYQEYDYRFDVIFLDPRIGRVLHWKSAFAHLYD